MARKIAIHQPYYLPWLGFLHKVYSCDVFVINDSSEFEKKDFTRRAKLDSESYLDIPLESHSDFEKIINLKINNENWRNKHVYKIFNNYRNHSLFKENIEFIEYTIFRTKYINNLTELNLQILDDILKLLGISRTIVRTSNYHIPGKKEESVINIIKHFNGDEYISGAAASAYQDKAHFESNGIRLIYQDMYSYLNDNPYKQKGKQFQNGLCFVDPLFNIGAEGIMKILKEYRME
ncbi:hypothetical protein DOJK_00205 [Patescibacteria group bacterium]|nr:hypothetical protein DOJK_00205 [Patescibacteria group bacterium]